MVWKYQRKHLPITSQKGHGSNVPGVSGRLLANLQLNFTPLELYGAAARCSHLHPINPALASPESRMVAAMVEQYVDERGVDFALNAAIANLKDFSRTHLIGAVAQGLSYLAMIQNGYVWSDHFENIVGGNLAIRRKPDFVFTGSEVGTALVESKGTASAGKEKFDDRVGVGYLKQVEPHLGHAVGASIATHGYCIGSWLTSSVKAEAVVHHTALQEAHSEPSNPSDGPSLEVQQHSYATAFSLVAGLSLADQIRTNRVAGGIEFYRFKWLGRSWLTRQFLFIGLDDPIFFFPPTWRYVPASMGYLGFAMEENRAAKVLKFFSRDERGEKAALPVEPMPRALMDEARGAGGGQEGAIFPDGLAVIGQENHAIGSFSVIRWNGQAFT